MPMRMSLDEIADKWHFPRWGSGLDLQQYRTALAEIIGSTDPIEAQEVRIGKPWSQWTEEEQEEAARDQWGVPQ